MRLFLALFAAAAAWAATAWAATLSMPDWLAPYPGVTPNTQTSNALVESSYSAAAKPAEIVAHYEKQLAGAGVPALVNDDGLGISIRASAPECDLLIRVRERQGASYVSVDCSDKTPAPAQGTFMPSGKATTAAGSRQPMMSTDIRTRHDEIVANMKANMKNYDQPIYPDSKATGTAPASTAPIVLRWPSWLVTAKGADHGLDVQRKKYVSGMEYLETEYKTSAPMSEIYEFYKKAMSANGFTVRQSNLSTGSTSTHVQQNARGSVEGASYPNGTGNGSIVIRADFSRMFLNEPITVRLSVSVYPAVRSSRN
ncbi:MAG TPA: hypothetical protein VKG79_10800 [Bryobacteraceae bacterium]|nr:hypothetical protein [Bryobacteraceae bacterium]